MKEELEKVINESLSMREAANKLNMSFSTFKRKAKEFGLYKTNQSGLGIIKSNKTIEDVLSGKTHMKSTELRKRLVKEGYLENKCSICSLEKWNGLKIVLELDHIDGNNKNNSLDNLRILCPNCHSQTPTFRGRKS